MTIDEFRELVDRDGTGSVSLLHKYQAENTRVLSAANFLFYDEVLHYLNTMVTASIGKHVTKGGIVQDIPTVRFIGHATDEDIRFPGIWMHWGNVLEIEVAEFQIDIGTVDASEKAPPNHDVKVGDFGIHAAATLITNSMDKAAPQIEAKHPGGWFDNWPDQLRLAKLLRNASAHDGNWGIREIRNREHYQHEQFRWRRADLTIQMRDTQGNAVDEGNPALPYFNGCDLILLLLEISDDLNA